MFYNVGKKTEKQIGHSVRFTEKIGSREERRKRAEMRKNIGIWQGLAMFGRVGWTIVLPGLIGVSFGSWIDGNYPGVYSWALMLLGGGIGFGCINAWLWLSKEYERVKREVEEQKHD
ncbi:MAG: AtpZ/AtpI family protein [Candidatus Riflebacteria bacterium]|nr:AtpZ/AtpI family protein [Candidatus Riflebacteria bacterium]